MSYDVAEASFDQVASDYVGEFSRVPEPKDLPIQQPTKFELVI